MRELDEALGLTEMAGEMIREGRTGRNMGHEMTGLLRQSVCARLAGYEDVNDQELLLRDPAMRAAAGRKALERNAASSQTAARFETETLATDENLAALSEINHAWVKKAMRGGHTRGASYQDPCPYQVPGHRSDLRQAVTKGKYT